MSPPASTSHPPRDPADFQPPFPPHATSPDPTSPAHPTAEQVVNATAAHVFPEHPAPGNKEHEGKKDVSKEGIEKDDEQKNKDEEQEPIIKGTPLDEMITPMLERSAFGLLGPRKHSSRQGTAETIKPPSLPALSIIPPEESEAEGQESMHGEVGGTAYAPIHAISGEEPTPTETQNRDMQNVLRGTDTATGRPGFGASRDIGSVRMGASALISALNALPWEGEGEESGSSSDEEKIPSARMKGNHRENQKSKLSRMHSSLHTIRPMSATTPVEEDLLDINPSDPSYFASQQHRQQSLHFPFRQNTIARRARSPGPAELSYQFAAAQRRRKSPPVDSSEAGEEVGVPGPRRASDESDGGLPVGGDLRKMVNQQIEKEEIIGEAEEEEEMTKAAASQQTPHPAPLDLAPPVDAGKGDLPREDNVDAALRVGSEAEDEIVEDFMDSNPQEKKRLRREKLAEKLMDVFGLEEREEVLEEMRCWLLRSVMLKGYMYLTPRHICFFAHMPDRENLVVKTGPLSKKNSRTKMNTKFWAVLKNDVLSWFESTADPYFPKGNVSLQYASSCDPVDTHRFKLRTSERNYTFTADTSSARDEWIKAIKKVMFKTQHEGESVKLIIPLEAVLEVDKSPTLEFAETIEIKCVDPEDHMSVDSYFFASFQDGDRAIHAIQRTLDERPSSDLPRVASDLSMRAEAESSAVAARKAEEGGPLGIKKLGSVLKPLMSRSTDHKVDDEDNRSGFSIPFISRHKPSHDSLETLRVDSSQSLPVSRLETGSPSEIAPDDDYEGYPPRQSGQPPSSISEENKAGWGTWIKKPASKIFGSSPSQGSLLGRSPTGSSSLSRTPPRHTAGETGITDSPTAVRQRRSAPHTRTGRGKRESVTEVVEPTFVADTTEGEETDDEATAAARRVSQGARLSFSSSASDGSGMLHPEYSMMERSESAAQEDLETARKFRNVFSLPEKEELIDHFPGYLYRVLPVSGRFFVSTNYFCFRSSQLLYKTKMIIPIRDLYGLKAQKAFRFGHHGLIIVIKGHEELFLEFSSAKRRSACVALLEERMESSRLRNDGDVSSKADMDHVAMKIMEDLDESSPIEPKNNVPAVSPSPLFGSTTSTFLEFKPEPMRITCLTIGSRGDVQPYIALCKGLQAEGHTTRIATHGEYKDWVEGHGIEFASVGGDPAELMQMCVDNGMFTVSFLKEGLQKFRGWLDELLHSSWIACQGSDLLIESPSAMGGIHIAEALQIPYYRAFTMPWTRTRAYPHAFAVPEHKRGGSYNYMTYTMFDQVFWRAIAGQVNRFRRKTLGIEATNFDKLEQHKVPFLYNFSPNVVPPPLDWTEWIHVTGYWFLENADESAEKDQKWSPPKDLVEFIDNAHAEGKKVVYIGFGSIVVSDPQEMTRCVVDAVVESGVCAILSKGWSDRGSKAKGEDKGNSDGADGVKYPPEIFPIDSIDHSWLFPRIDAACHHGGAGTSGASLRAGIPTIIKPFFGDQAFWSERVESLNVGSAVRKLTAEHLAEALRQATTDERQIAKAKVVGEMIRKENGVARAIEAIYRDLEYAKALIKPPPEERLANKPSTISLLNPINDLSFVRSRSRSQSSKHKPKVVSQSTGTDGSDEHGHVSDSSWSVLSEDQQNTRELLSSPEALTRSRSRSESDSRRGSGSGFFARVKDVVVP